MSTVKPVSPQDLASGVVHAAPAFVIEAFNNMITRTHVNGRAQFTQKAVVEEIQRLVQVSKEDIYKSGWLNVEPHFRSAGWNVVFDKPGYNESYDAYFVFSVKVMS